MGFEGIPAGVRCRDKAMLWRRKVWRGRSLSFNRMELGEEKKAAGGDLNSAAAETGELDLNKRDLEDLWLAYLFQ